ncbi:UNVERIFIED_CONTAM: hypothetical protein H355_002273 [Colinus virginianus]|nr:hypothetical protein H355_002273 [Colinus virginianus]
MPGLINQSSRCPLPLTASEVTSCVSGYALGMTAALTYCNPCAQPCRGKIVMDEDLERIAFVANLGTIPPLESVSVFISTSSELQTLPSGAVRVLLPAVCVPRVPQPSLENTSSLSSHLLRTDKQCCASGEHGSRFCLAQLLQSEATNPSEYEFSFHLEIRGPCLLAGVESPTHEIRADADPSARSAKSIVITLANRHTFDRAVEILIHPSEPHMPHILMEEGDMTPAEYEQHLKGKNDFIKGTKKDPSAEKKTEIIRKRLHKDIPHHPVVMLNFCPELSAAPADLRDAPREFIFLVDCSGSSTSISRAKDALLVALKSLMPTCLFNIITFSSTFKSLFPSSRTYCEESLATACESIRRMRADAGSPNILSPLKWIVRQPIHRGHPRLLFLLTHGAADSTGTVLELLRSHSCSTSFGVGPHACSRLVQGVAAVSRGIAEFLAEGERLQPKLIRSLKKAMAPVLSDVTVEWVFPESTEALVSPISTSCLFPGDHLVGYSIVCDTSLYIPKPRADKRRRYSTMCSQESGSSVFFHSQEEGTAAESWSYPEGCSTPDQLAVGRDLSRESDTDADTKASCRRRAYSANQISDHQPLSKEPTASDPGSVLLRNPLRKTQLQDLQQLSPELQPLHFQLNAVHTSKACNVISKYTAFVPLELSSGTYLPPIIEYSHTDTDEPRLSPCSTPLSSSWKHCRIPEVPFQSLPPSTTPSPKPIESIFAARLTLQKTRLLTRAAKGFVSKSLGRASEASSESESSDYLPLVSLQLACGAFLMNNAFCEAVSIPMEKLCWTSPFSCHRLALSPSSSSSTKKPEQHRSPTHGRQLLVPCSSAWDTGGATESTSEALRAESELSPPAISICSSPQSPAAEQRDASISQAGSTDVQTLLLDIELQKQKEPEGMLWATAVALAWLEHSSASHFTEWELVAAKASLWLGEQDFPQGCSLAAVKSAAQQLFVLLRHWDENLEFNLLCYNPGSV